MSMHEKCCVVVRLSILWFNIVLNRTGTVNTRRGSVPTSEGAINIAIQKTHSDRVKREKIVKKRFVGI